MATDDTPYAPRVRYIELLEREKSNVTELKIYRNRAQIVPTGCTYTSIRPDGIGVVQDGVANIDTDGTLSYTHPANHFPSTINLGEGYIQMWTATIDGKEYVFRRSIAIVKRRLYPTVSDTDLETEYSDLANLRPASLTSYQIWILLLPTCNTTTQSTTQLILYTMKNTQDEPTTQTGEHVAARLSI